MTLIQERLQTVDIDKELRRLWKEEHGKNKVRACLFNFILYTSKSDKEAYYKELVKSVITKFPSRVIFITTDEEAQDHLLVDVSTQTVGEGKNSIYCEIIHINAGGSSIKRVPSLFLPHLVPDLPVYLLWTQDLSCENFILPQLEKLTKKIIFNPESTSDLQLFAASVLSIVEQFHCEMGDLNWSALGEWRKLIAANFDTEESLKVISEAKIVRIYFNQLDSKDSTHLLKAAYLQAWLASQLGWRFITLEKEEGHYRLLYQRMTKEVIIYLMPQEISTVCAGEICGIEIESLHRNSEFVFKRHPQSQQVFMQYSDQHLCELPYFMTFKECLPNLAIIEEVFSQRSNQHYYNMLQTLSQIPWRSVL